MMKNAAEIPTTFGAKYITITRGILARAESDVIQCHSWLVGLQEPVPRI